MKRLLDLEPADAALFYKPKKGRYRRRSGAPATKPAKRRKQAAARTSSWLSPLPRPDGRRPQDRGAEANEPPPHKPEWARYSD